MSCIIGSPALHWMELGNNIPHSTKLGELIRYNEEYARMYTELIVSDLTFGVASVSGNRKDRL